MSCCSYLWSDVGDRGLSSSSAIDRPSVHGGRCCPISLSHTISTIHLFPSQVAIRRRAMSIFWSNLSPPVNIIRRGRRDRWSCTKWKEGLLIIPPVPLLEDKRDFVGFYEDRDWFNSPPTTMANSRSRTRSFRYFWYFCVFANADCSTEVRVEHVISGTIKLVTLPADDLQRYTFGMGFVLLLIRHSASSPRPYH